MLNRKLPIIFFFRGFGKYFGLLPAKVIVIGSDVVPYFGPLEKALIETPVLVGDQSYLLIPSFSELMRSAQRKRELMALLNGWF